jgi:uncharacterized protein
MPIALTGASGFLGQQVICAATRRGHEVVAFSRDPRRIVHGSVETRRFSLEVAPDFSGCEAVIHLAGENVAGLWTRAKMRRIIESRVLGTRRVVEGLRNTGPHPEVLVCASATGFYGDQGDVELTEESPAGSGFLADTCKAWEEEAAAACDVCRVASLRFGLVLGKNGGALRPMAALFRCFLGGNVSHGQQWWSWIHVEDAATLLIFTVENLDARGPINATAPWPARNVDFTRALARVVHRPAIARAPAWALRLMLRGFACELLASRRVLPAAACALGFPFRFAEVEPAIRDTLA